MRTFAIVNQKGGCGKTTVAVNLAACLAREGRRVLLIDMDPQGHCALGLAVPEEQIEMSMVDVLVPDEGKIPIDLPRVVWQITANFDLAPSRIDLARFDPSVATAADRHERLARAIEAVDGRYDVVLIDCPPGIGALSFNALTAATDVIIPVDTGYFSLQGLTKQLETIDHLNDRNETKLAVHILANQYDVRTKLAREILAEMRRKFDPLMFRAFINFNTKLREGASFGQPITEYDPTSMGFRDFVRLAREVAAIAGEPGAAAVAAAEPPDALLRRAAEIAANAKELLATSQTLLGNVEPDVTKREPPAEAAQPAALADLAAAANPEEIEELAAEATSDQIEELIEQIYGVRQIQDGVTFATHAPGATSVCLAGDFNDWNPDTNPMFASGRDGQFSIILPLEPGLYRYRLVVDGDWRHDPHNSYVESNPYGGLNSVVEVA